MASKPQKYKPALARCLTLCDRNHAAASVMYRLMFWKPSVQHKERKWIAKSHVELMWETGLSMTQVKAGVSYLQKKEFIEIERHLFGGLNLNHYLVKPAFREAFEAFGALDGKELKKTKEEFGTVPFEESV